MTAKKGKILVVDDNEGIRQALKILLPARFEKVEAILSPSTIVSAMEAFQPDVVLLDMNFMTSVNTGNEGLYWLGRIKRMFPDVEVVLFTAYGDISLAVEGMKRGAFDFIVKPWANDKLISVLEAARDKARKTKKSAYDGHDDETMYWGESRRMLEIRDIVLKTAPTDASVLITGENGTGKDMLAKEIHSHSLRKAFPMVGVDVGAIPETLFESELFGHVKGAFTDAHTDRAGKFELSDGGTLFLDEIGNIPLHLQAKLLRVLQSRSVVRVGGDRQIPVDIRLICATNKDIEALVKEGLFREDLYYRINTVHISLPSLRERAGDIIPLAERFLRFFAEKYHRNIEGFDDPAKESMLHCRWSGNIRELRNCVERAVILSDGGFIGKDDLGLGEAGRFSDSSPRDSVAGALDEEERVKDAMRKCGGNISAAAKMLSISRPTLYAKLKKYGL